MEVSGRVIFINPDYAIHLTSGSTPVVMSGYETAEHFETAISILGKYIAVLDKYEGVTFYKL